MMCCGGAGGTLRVVGAAHDGGGAGAGSHHVLFDTNLQLAMTEVKKISAEDVRFRLEKEVQKVTDEYIARVDDIEKAKEKSIDEHST